jgi:hypothetical protein
LTYLPCIVEICNADEETGLEIGVLTGVDTGLEIGVVTTGPYDCAIDKRYKS